jgi:glycosyltransferase involved in cell wall biosynthesis
MISIVIPSRNEPYLQKTIQDLLQKAKGDIQIIAVLDGYWLKASEFVHDRHVEYIHFTDVRGMRNAINAAVRIAKGDYILKTDAHCMFSEGYDVSLTEFCQDNWVVVPRRYALLPEEWTLEPNPKYPVDYMYLSKDGHGVVWDEKNKDIADITVYNDLMSSQGSCWFMKKDYYTELELMDEKTFGTFASEFQEIGLKCWLSGGRVIVNKKCWYAHWHKTESRGYTLDKTDGNKATEFVSKWMNKQFTWHKQIRDIDWLVEHFAPVPTWI